MSRTPPAIAGPPSPELIGQLLDRHGPALVLYARQLCNSPDDVLQEALVRFASLRECPRDLLAWLFHAVRNGALTAARASRRRKKHEALAAEARPREFASAAGDRLDAQATAEALARLPERDREIIVARIWGGLTFVEIGRLVGLSDSSAQRQYVAALGLLREQLLSRGVK